MRNFYFAEQNKSEQNLYEDIVIESLKIYGEDLYYIPRDLIGEERILGDEIPARFNSSHKIEMYIENTEGFDGEGDLFTRFGVEIRDEATFIVSRRRWTQQVKRQDSEVTAIRPLEGDLIYVPMSKSLFQIMHVEHEQPFYQLRNLPLYKMRCQLFEYNDEDLDTGVKGVDSIETDFAMTYKLQMTAADASTDFKIGHHIKQTLATTVIEAEISKWDKDNLELHVVHLSADDGKYHEFTAGNVIYYPYWPSLDSPSTHAITVVTEDMKQTKNEQNADFDTFGADFLDFSEDNPFGDPND
tara:strand:- start:1630 stop:2526 length:897 start_codon:yes stop_codon:yes gene_type:complete